MKVEQFRYRIRKKGNYYSLDKLEEGIVIKSWTLNPKKLAQIYECPTENGINVSKNVGENVQFDSQKFDQPLLNEQRNVDTEPEIKKGDIQKELNRLMKDIL